MTPPPLIAATLYAPKERPIWLIPSLLFDGEKLQPDRAILFDKNGVVSRMASAKILLAKRKLMQSLHAKPPSIQKWAGTAAPGLFDVQVNGGGNVMFNTTPTFEGIRQIIAAHRARGTAWILPTFITDEIEAMQQAAAAIITAWQQQIDGFAGVHFEGPHINPIRKGAHKAEFIRPFAESTMNIMRELRAYDIPVMLTLAPECVAPGVIAELTRLGVVVSLGHSEASENDVRRAISEGARAVTHLFNAMSGLQSREPGLVGTALDSDLICGVIADLHHVAATSLRLAIRARPAANLMMLVSDAMPSLGGSDHFTLYGETIRVAEGKLVNQAGSLAGAQIDLAQSVMNMVTAEMTDQETALAMATRIPAQLMGVWPRIGRLDIGTNDVTLLPNLG
ncbi:MAG: amidohydrolase family protein [Alphaproteobacteria bacterium]|nr:amidohydrolase family protein [Alphaproteobacteria bacterium]